MNTGWREGNRVTLLEDGEDYFPRIFAAIGQARHEVLLEAFILFDDKVGQALREVLIDAARRGVRVECTFDGWGSADLPREFIEGMTEAGVCFRLFDPGPRPFGMRLKMFHRMHRKLAVIDGRIAFCGGINFSADHLDDFGPQAKTDFAVELEGPVVSDIHAFLESTLVPPTRWRHWLPWRGWRLRLPRYRTKRGRSHGGRGDSNDVGGARVLFVHRDNDQHPNAIERQYRAAIRAARSELVIANAYFFPGYRLLRDIRNAARRGVTVKLVLQGKPDSPLAMAWARMLYRYLVHGGVVIHEYCRKPLHGKVAVVDGVWATVGSSNMDPLSLSLNLEANVIIRDHGFAQHLRGRLLELVERHCKPITREEMPRPTLWETLRWTFVYHALRRFPSWAGLVPAHAQKVVVVPPPAQGGMDQVERVPANVDDAEPGSAAAPARDGAAP